MRLLALCRLQHAPPDATAAVRWRMPLARLACSRCAPSLTRVDVLWWLLRSGQVDSVQRAFEAQWSAGNRRTAGRVRGERGEGIALATTRARLRTERIARPDHAS